MNPSLVLRTQGRERSGMSVYEGRSRTQRELDLQKRQSVLINWSHGVADEGAVAACWSPELPRFGLGLRAEVVGQR